MTTNAYPYGDAYLYDVEDELLATYTWVSLLATYVPNRVTDHFLSNIAAYEASAPGRVVATGATITPSTTTGFVTFDFDDPDFGSPAGGEVIGSILLFADVDSNDAHAPLIARATFPHTCDGSPFVPTLNAAGFVRLRNYAS
jgi:hypothetical protein